MDSFLERFLYLQGKSEVPSAFYRWVGLSIMATACGTNVWFEKFKTKVAPNLYVLLIGPSGLGKGVAIDAGLRAIGDLSEYFGQWRGKITAPAIVEHMHAKAGNKEDKAPNRLFLVTPELSNSVGTGPMADLFVKMMTDFFTGGEFTFDEATRTNGRRTFRIPTINWLAGSTEEWLMKSISPDAIEGGFFGRCCPILQEDYGTERVYMPKFPNDYDEQLAWCQGRLHWFSEQRGQILMSRGADAYCEDWYMSRERPVDRRLLPTWKREHDMVIKLSMLLMLDEGLTTSVKRRHVEEAIRLAGSCLASVPYLVNLASSTPERDAVVFIKQFLMAHGRLHESVIYKQALDRSIVQAKVDDVLRSLVASHEVEVDKEPFANGEVRYYRWIGAKPF